MSQRSSFLDKVLWPLVLLALTPAFTLLGSKIASDDWLKWLRSMPSWAFWLFFGVIFAWLVIGIIVRRVRHLRARNEPSFPGIIGIPSWGYVTLAKLGHLGVSWNIIVPALPPWETVSLKSVRGAIVDVETPPHCPKCDTELEEAETFFGSYRWSCVRCGFMIKHSSSFYSESTRVQKIARSKWNEESKRLK